MVWGPAQTVALVADNELADAVVPDQGKPGPWAMAAILRSHRAARSIHFPKSLRPALAAFLAGVPERIGVDESLAGIFNTHSGPFWDAQGPFMARYHAVLAKRWPDLPPMPYADYAPRADVRLPGEPYLCLMPGSTWPSKTWPREHFLAAGPHGPDGGMAVAVLGSPGESGRSALSSPRTPPTISAAKPAWCRPPPGSGGPGPPWATIPASATWPPPAALRPWPSTAPPTRAAAPLGGPAPRSCAWTASPAPPASSPGAPSRATPAWPGWRRNGSGPASARFFQARDSAAVTKSP